MSLGWKIEDCLRSDLRIGVIYYKHVAYVENLFQAGITIDSIILRKRLAELQSDSLAHHSHCVDGIHQSLGVTF